MLPDIAILIIIQNLNIGKFYKPYLAFLVDYPRVLLYIIIINYKTKYNLEKHNLRFGKYKMKTQNKNTKFKHEVQIFDVKKVIRESLIKKHIDAGKISKELKMKEDDFKNSILGKRQLKSSEFIAICVYLGLSLKDFKEYSGESEKRSKQ